MKPHFAKVGICWGVLLTFQAPALAMTDACLRLLELSPGKGQGPVVKLVPIDMPGVEVASVEDATGSTGATLFFFPAGARAAYDARGGSVASAETHLLDAGSYSHEIDAIVFAGGSTMGLSAADGVRQEIFASRAQAAGAFEAIPSVPTAVVYDYGGRTHQGSDPLIHPTSEMGHQLMQARGQLFRHGRAGAGVCATCNKMHEHGRKFGGQGIAQKSFPWGNILVAVVVNPLGDIRFQGSSMTAAMNGPPAGQRTRADAQSRKNTTLSLVVTDANLDRNQLKRLSTAVHTSMAETIFPFHTYCDGDINFAVSVKSNRPPIDGNDEMELGIEASILMNEAIRSSVMISNGY